MSQEMQDFTRSRPVRAALARGLVRATLARARSEAADLPGCLRALLAQAPNRRARERTAARLAARPGVLRVTAGPGGEGLTVLLRLVQVLSFAPQDGPAFAETALVYARLTARPGRAGPRTGLGFLAFGPHALGRFAARGEGPLGPDLLPALDAEAGAAFRRMARGELIEDEGRHALPALDPGLWCGCLRWWRDEAGDPVATAPHPPAGGMRVPVLFLRTFLAPRQMNPGLRLRWEDLCAAAAPVRGH